jgi:hypothetical protein
MISLYLRFRVSKPFESHGLCNEAPLIRCLLDPMEQVRPRPVGGYDVYLLKFCRLARTVPSFQFKSQK